MINFNYKKLYFLVITATMLNSCTNEVVPDPVDCNTASPKVELESKTDTQCGVNNGEIKLKSSGGSGKYQYKLNSGDFQSSSTFSGLAAGTYDFTIKDENGCSTTFSTTILNSDGVNISSSSTDAGCGTAIGSITVIATNGVTPYSFKLNSGSFQSHNQFDNLSRGTYTITVKDATDCETTGALLVKSGVSYANQIQQIIANNCAISGCHNGSRSPNLTTFQGVQANASRIKTLTQNKSMPKDGSLTQAQIDAITCWVEDGAPNN
jgi:hypothetical protein